MEKEWMVSVVVVTYNHEAYIRQALDSILMQETDFPYEIVVGEDCSPDHTREILIEYQNRFPGQIRLFLREKNIGATANSYEIKTQCRGKYIAQLEGDDFWTDKKKLQKQVDFLEAHPEFIGVSHEHDVVDEEGKLIPDEHGYGMRGVWTLRDYRRTGKLPGQTATLLFHNIYQNPRHDYSIEARAHDYRSDMTVALILLLQGDFYCMEAVMSSRRLVRKQGSTNWNSVVLNRNVPLESCYMSQKLICWVRDEFGLDEEGKKRLEQCFEMTLILCLKQNSKQTRQAARDVYNACIGGKHFYLDSMKTILKTLPRAFKKYVGKVGT